MSHILILVDENQRTVDYNPVSLDLDLPWIEIKRLYSECIIQQCHDGHPKWTVDNPNESYHVDRITFSLHGQQLTDDETLFDNGINFNMRGVVVNVSIAGGEDGDATTNLEAAQQSLCVVGLNKKDRKSFSAMNCALQILSQTPFLVRFFADHALRSRKAKQEKNVFQKLGTAFASNSVVDTFGELCEFMYLSKNSEKDEDLVFNPKKIVKALGRDADADVAKCLSSLVRSLDEELAKGKSDDDSKSDKETVPHLFGGTTGVSFYCLQCRQTSRQSESFRVLDLRVVRHEVKLSNIHVIVDKRLIYIPSLLVSNDCTVNMLKHCIVDYLRHVDKGLDNVDTAVMTVCSMRPDGEGSLHSLDDGSKILDTLRKPNRTLLTFVPAQPKISSKRGPRVVKLWCLYAQTVDATLDHVLASSVTHNFVECEASKIAQHILRKQPSVVEYNGHFIDATQAQNYDFDKLSVENVNVLSLITVAPAPPSAGVSVLRDVDEFLVDEFLVYEAQAAHVNAVSPIAALQQELQQWQSQSGSSSIQLQSTLGKQEINSIREDKHQRVQSTLSALQKLANLHQQVKSLGSARYESVHTPMESVAECFEHYQRPTLVDEHFNCNCRVHNHATLTSKRQLQIKHYPQILLLHLNRRSKPANFKNSAATSQYYVGQIICAKFTKPKIGDDRWYAARIEEICKSGSIKIQYFCDGKSDILLPREHRQRIKGHCAWTEHYDHQVKYDATLAMGNTKYDLYAVISCRESSEGAIRAVTVKSLADGLWYDVCDEHVLLGAQPLRHSSTATILAYQRCE